MFLIENLKFNNIKYIALIQMNTIILDPLTMVRDEVITKLSQFRPKYKAVKDEFLINDKKIRESDLSEEHRESF